MYGSFLHILRRAVTLILAAIVPLAACHGAETPAAAPADSRAPGTTTPATPTTGTVTTNTAPPAPSSPETTRAQTAPSASTVACGRMPGEKIEKTRWMHGDGNAECDRLETLWANIPHDDLTCKTDSDCTVMTTDGNCINKAMSKTAAAKAIYAKMPCGNPVSGACPARGIVAKCADGCCAVR